MVLLQFISILCYNVFIIRSDDDDDDNNHFIPYLTMRHRIFTKVACILLS